MRNKNALIGIAIVVIGVIFVIFMFTNINSRPSAGDGQTEQDNVSASAREVAPDVVGGEAPDQPAPSP
jgi:hypothetical protein